MSLMWGLTASELGLVVFIFLLVAAAAKLPGWGEAIGGYLYRRAVSAGRKVRPRQSP
jgi:hypothetical protein